MTLTTAEIWMVIAGLGLGTFLVRFSFLGLIGDRPLPPLVMHLLRYTPVAVIPGLAAPLVLWPEATDGMLNAPRLTAAAVTLLAGVITRNIVAAIFFGAVTLYTLLWLIG